MKKQVEDKIIEDENIEVGRDDSDFWFACVDISVLRDTTLSPESRLIFSIICTYASTLVERFWPSIERVAKDSGFCIKIVEMAYMELEYKGLLTRLFNRSVCGKKEEEES